MPLILSSLDIWLFGGLSLAAVLVLAIPFEQSNFYSIFWTLNLLFSFPHFLASYPIFYGKNGNWREHRFVAVGIPILLLLVLGFGIAAPTEDWMHGMGQLTMFLLYWHYLKQAYGVTLWVGTPRGQRLPASHKTFLLCVCLAMGVGGYLGGFESPNVTRAFGLYLRPLVIPSFALVASRYLGPLAVVTFFAWMAWKRPMRWSACVPLLALWTWMDPIFDGNPIKLILPVFHGLQYLPFPIRVMVNEQEKAGLSKKAVGLRMAGWGILSLGLGYFFFYGLPYWISFQVPSEKAARAFASPILFLNLHHYFIDSVAWRFREKKTGERLQGPPPPSAVVEDWQDIKARARSAR